MVARRCRIAKQATTLPPASKALEYAWEADFCPVYSYMKEVAEQELGSMKENSFSEFVLSQRLTGKNSTKVLRQFSSESSRNTLMAFSPGTDSNIQLAQ